MEVFSSDRPLTDPHDDRLGYAPFAKQLAASILRLAPTDGIVIAIYGPWGSGKTTLLNFVKFYLDEVSEDKAPVVMDFNPWWFTGHEDLTRRFFDQLRSVLSRWKVIGERAIKQLAKFAEIVAEAPSAKVSWIGKRVAKLGQPKDVTSLKDSIVKELRRLQHKIVVVIDDIDRLTADEVRQLFQVIKAVADFPNLIYVLGFDKEVAVKALSETQGLPGEIYLQKIVQVPFELPLPDKMALRQLLFERLDRVLVDTPEELFDQSYWSNVYFEGLDRFIETPRNIVVLMNTLRVTYAAVVGEVSAVDFITVEALRVFRPGLYDLIRRNPQSFVGHSANSGFLRPDVDSLKRFHQAYLDQLEEKEREPIKALLRRLFPKLEAIWGNTHYGAEWEGTWRKQRRVCSPDVFPAYFRLAVPSGGISNAEMKAALALTSDATTFAQRLLELADQIRPDGTTRVREFLERLQDYTGADIPTDHIPAVIEALLDVGDQLLRPEDQRRGMFDFRNDIRIGRVLWQLLRRLDRSARTELLKRAMRKGRATAIIVHEIIVLGQQHGKYSERQPDPESERLVGEDDLKELEALGLERIRNAARDGTLLGSPELPMLLYRWRDWAGEADAKEWARETTADDGNLLAFLEKFGQVTFSQTLTDSVGSTAYRLNPKSLEPFLDLVQVAARLKRILESQDLTEDQRRAARQFLREYELWQQGKDPDDPLSWVNLDRNGEGWSGE